MTLAYVHKALRSSLVHRLSTHNAYSTLPSAWTHPISTSTKQIHQKSSFLAHASILNGPTDLPLFFAHLESLPRLRKDLKKATHRMSAWKIKNGVQSGQSDGGESGAGNLLAKVVGSHKVHESVLFEFHLSVLLKVSLADIVVVVWRWYGGQQLGPKRWRIISQVAGEAMGQLK